MIKGSRSSHGRGTASAALTEGEAIFLAKAVRRTGRAAIHPVNGDALTAWPLGAAKPVAMYRYSRSESWRVLAVQKHCARNASSMSPAKTCGLPTLNSLTTWSMNSQLYHARPAQCSIHKLLRAVPSRPISLIEFSRSFFAEHGGTGNPIQRLISKAETRFL